MLWRLILAPRNDDNQAREAGEGSSNLGNDEQEVIVHGFSLSRLIEYRASDRTAQLGTIL